MNTRFFHGLSNNHLVDNLELNAIIAHEWKQKYKISKIKIDITYNSIVIFMMHQKLLNGVKKNVRDS